MKSKNISIEYYVYPDGEDFTGLDEFSNDISSEYLLKINKKTQEGYGSGFYDLLIQITEDISLLELAKSYAEDGIKILLGYSFKVIFQSVRKLFNRNKDLAPSIRELTIYFNDGKILIYNILDNGIEDLFDKILERILEFRIEKIKFFDKIKTIHIPIINNKDFYGLCDFRVKLNVDEPVSNFSREDYFKFWGISTKKKSMSLT